MPSPAGRSRLSVPLLALACALLALLPAAAPRTAAASGPIAHIAARTPARATERPTALIALLPIDTNPPPPGVLRPTVGDLIDGHPELALGMLSATQSGYSPQQSLLDMTAGTRTSRGTYHPQNPPDMSLLPVPALPGSGGTGRQGLIVNWLAAVARAESAPADIFPGLLASSIPGGAGYAGIRGQGQTNLEAVLAATRAGVVDEVSLGHGDTVAARASALLRAPPPRRRAAAARLRRRPPARPADRRAGPQRAADRARGPARRRAGRSCCGPGSRASAPRTRASRPRRRTSTGSPPRSTCCRRSCATSASRSRPRSRASRSGPRASATPTRLQKLDDRLAIIGPRRIPALETFMLTWLGLMLLGGILRDRAGVRFAMRIGGLALMWLPAVLLGSAALMPSQQAELFLSRAARSGLRC